MTEHEISWVTMGFVCSLTQSGLKLAGLAAVSRSGGLRRHTNLVLGHKHRGPDPQTELKVSGEGAVTNWQEPLEIGGDGAASEIRYQLVV